MIFTVVPSKHYYLRCTFFGTINGFIAPPEADKQKTYVRKHELLVA
jgi:hypothetical protein